MAELTPEEIQALVLLARNIYWRYELDLYEEAALLLLLSAVRKAERNVLNTIQTRGATLSEWSEDRSLALLDELSNMTLGLRVALTNSIADVASQAGANSYLTHNAIVSFDGMVPRFNPVSLSAAQLRSIVTEVPIGGHLLRDWVDRTFDQATVSGIREEILAGRLLGEGYPELVSRVAAGLSETENGIISLVRTTVQSMNVNAMEAVYDANREVVKGVEWSAVMEVGGTQGRGTCIRCASLDSTKFLWDEPRPPCPLHIRCLISSRVLIRTDNGWKPIGKMQVGDMVLTHKLRYRPVTELIFTPLQRPMVVKLYFKREREIIYGSGKFHECPDHYLTLTEDHPVMVNGQWLEAKHIKIGDKVTILATRCKRCGKLLPYFYDYCSKTCRQLDTTDKQYANRKPGRYDHLKARLKSAGHPKKVEFDPDKLEFIEIPISNMEHRLLGKIHKLYNFSVEEDESYIARGFVVHNCRCVLLPLMRTWRELGLDVDEMADRYRPWTRRTDVPIGTGRRGRTILESGFHQGSFATWFDTLSSADQISIVGPGRFGLLNSGAISFQDLVDSSTGRLRLLDKNETGRIIGLRGLESTGTILK
jgi:hypothetical protein